MKLFRSFLFALLLAFIGVGFTFAQTAGSVGGQVVDVNGAVVVGATVTAVAANGKQKQAISNARGEFSISGLAPGKYTVRASATNFGVYENTEVNITPGQRSELSVVLTIADIKANVDVNTANQVSLDPDSQVGATVLKGADLDSLPDDPDDMEAALQALAGAAAGPNGGQIYIDGFTGGQLPPKESIREIRINQNPFSAEYDRMGMGRIEIFTKPGSDKWRGSFNGRFNNQNFNARNPFAINRAPAQTIAYGGQVSGPIQKGKTSFSLDFNRSTDDGSAVVNALVLDPSFNVVSFQQEFRQPRTRTSIGPRLDYAINSKNTLVARYSFTDNTATEQNVGGTSLPSLATTSSNREHELRVTYTTILSAKTVNETRFEYSTQNQRRTGDNTIPTVNVSSYFSGGGSQVGLSFTRNHNWEVNNMTITSWGKNSQHAIKFGVRLHDINVTDQSESGYGGSFSFSGVPGLTSMDQYRGAVMGLAGSQYDPTQFSITTGNPLQTVSRFDSALFITDDWRISPALLVSGGLRYENQTNIHSNLNFAPRFGIAWSPGAGGAKQPKTVFRGGGGVFYDRFSENNTLAAERFNGVNQLNLIVSANETDPVRRAAALALLAQSVFTLNGVTNVPTAAQVLAALPQSNTIRTVADNIQAPYTMQVLFGVERQLPAKSTVAVYFTTSRTLHQIRQRNINAPVCLLQDCSGLTLARPQPALGSEFEYESSGVTDQKRVFVNYSTRFSTKVFLGGSYSLGFVKTNAEGFPAYSYDLSTEYGRSSGDVRHNASLYGTITLPWQVTLNPLVSITSGRPFNITLGQDLNGDLQFNERPTFGQVRDKCASLGLKYAWCNIGSNDPTAIIPRNYGEGPGAFSFNLRIGKTFGFGKSATTAAAGNADGGGRPGGGGRAIVMAGGGGMRGGGGGGDRGGGGFGGGDVRKPYTLNFNINVNNVFNHPNFSPPVGTLNSSRFGQITGVAGGFGGFGGGGFGGGTNGARRIELNMRFSW